LHSSLVCWIPDSEVKIYAALPGSKFILWLTPLGGIGVNLKGIKLVTAQHFAGIFVIGKLADFTKNAPKLTLMPQSGTTVLDTASSELP
jgi:hypothetical protein